MNQISLKPLLYRKMIRTEDDLIEILKKNHYDDELFYGYNRGTY